MRGRLHIVRAFSLGLCTLLGCQHREAFVKPELKEEFVLPPSDDSRFSSPPTFPKETLDSGIFQKEQQQQKPGEPFKPRTGFGGPPNRMGMGGGMQ